MSQSPVLAVGVTLLLAVPLAYNFGQSKGREKAYRNVRLVQMDLSPMCTNELEVLWNDEIAVQEQMDADKEYLER